MAIIDIQHATPKDVPLILEFIKSLGEYERVSHEVVATEEDLRESLFGKERQYAEVIIAYCNSQTKDEDHDQATETKVPAGFAIFFHNFSTSTGRQGMYLEGLFVKPEFRGKGIGKSLLARLAAIAKERNCARCEWVVIDWNKPSRNFYESLGAKPYSEWIPHRLDGKALDDLAAL